jgi:ribonuclease-3
MSTGQEDIDISRAVNAVLRRFAPELEVSCPDAYVVALREPGTPPWERLEFLGDAVIGLAAAHDGFFRYPSHSEGKLSRYRTSLVRGTTLREMSKFAGVWDLLPDGVRTMEDCKLAEDVVECFVGAVYLDKGFEAALEWFTAMARAYEREKPMWTASAERLRSVRNCAVDVRKCSDATWTCTVLMGQTQIGYARADNKRDAEERACADSLRYLGIS